MKRNGLLLLWLLLMYTGIHAQNNKQGYKYDLIDTLPFQNSAHHWYDIFEKENIINAVPNQPRYDPSQVIAIADNVLLYQKNNGGWPKNYDMRAILTEEQKLIVAADKNNDHTTFDNSTTYSHVACLAKVYTATGIEKYKEACLRGLDFILNAQYANGGWPQFFPLREDYSRSITFNDDVMTGIMDVMKDISEQQPQYSFLDKKRIARAGAAFKTGMDCIIKTQLNDNGKLTAWCQQYDEVTLKAGWARKFEPPSICNRESATLVLFLMSIDQPSKEIINAVQNAARWFNESKIIATRVRSVPAPTVTFKTRVSNTDKIVVIDSSAPPIWARYYELGSHKPLFCNRDGVIVYSLAKVERERRDGYGWYVYDPKQVLSLYPAWQSKWAPGEDVLHK